MRALGAILFTMSVVSSALGDGVNPFDPNSTWPGARERARAMARPVPMPAPQLGSPSRLLPPGALAAPFSLSRFAEGRMIDESVAAAVAH